VLVRDVMMRDRPHLSFALVTEARQILAQLADVSWQDSFPVLDGAGALRGLITGDTLQVLANNADHARWAIAADLMQPAVAVRPEDDLRRASRAMLAHGLRQIPVVDGEGKIVGFLDEAETVKAYVAAAPEPT
jgi:CBS domain-containing protein